MFKVVGGKMRKGIHPRYEPCVVKCACGNTFETCSTIGDIQLDICSACHPYYTGRQKMVDSAGRIDSFIRRYGADRGKVKPGRDDEQPSDQ